MHAAARKLLRETLFESRKNVLGILTDLESAGAGSPAELAVKLSDEMLMCNVRGAVYDRCADQIRKSTVEARAGLHETLAGLNAMIFALDHVDIEIRRAEQSQGGRTR